MPRPQSDGATERTSGSFPPNEESSEPTEPWPTSKPGDHGPGLYVVATPIGHAADITLKALGILGAASVIACEDTRVSAKLMQIHGIRTPLIAYHDHNADIMRPRLLAQLAAGARIALISDAGTPLVSDPGYKLVRDALAGGHRVHVAPGPSAPIAALILSGLPSDRFMFAGFLDAKQAGRRRDLATLAAVPATLIFFESAPRLARSLADMAEILGNRPAAVAREITKFYEEVRRAPLTDLARHYAEAGPPKGEIVVVVGPPMDDMPAPAQDIETMLRAALVHFSVRDAADQVAAALRQPRRAVYAQALALAKAQTQQETPEHREPDDEPGNEPDNEPDNEGADPPAAS